MHDFHFCYFFFHECIIHGNAYRVAFFRLYFLTSCIKKTYIVYNIILSGFFTCSRLFSRDHGLGSGKFCYLKSHFLVKGCAGIYHCHDSTVYFSALRNVMSLCHGFCLALRLQLCFCLALNLCLDFGFCLNFFHANPLCGYADDGFISLNVFNYIFIGIFGGSGFNAAVHQYRGYFIPVCGDYGEKNGAVHSLAGAVCHVSAVRQHSHALSGFKGHRVSYMAVLFRICIFRRLGIFGQFFVCNRDHRIFRHVGDLVLILFFGLGNVDLIRSYILNLIVLVGNDCKGKGILLFYFLIIGRNSINCYRVRLILHLDLTLIRSMRIKSNPVEYFLLFRLCGLFLILVLRRLIVILFRLLLILILCRLFLLFRLFLRRCRLALCLPLGLRRLLLFLRSFLCCLTLGLRLGRRFCCLTLGLRLGRRFRRLTLGLRLGSRFRCLALGLCLGRRFCCLALGLCLSRRFCCLALRLCLGRRFRRLTLGLRLSRRFCCLALGLRLSRRFCCLALGLRLSRRFCCLALRLCLGRRF